MIDMPGISENSVARIRQRSGIFLVFKYFGNNAQKLYGLFLFTLLDKLPGKCAMSVLLGKSKKHIPCAAKQCLAILQSHFCHVIFCRLIQNSIVFIVTHNQYRLLPYHGKFLRIVTEILKDKKNP